MSELLEQKLVVVEHTVVEGQESVPLLVGVEYAYPPISRDERFLGNLAAFGAIGEVEALDGGAERFTVTPHSSDLGGRAGIVNEITKAYRAQPGGADSPIQVHKTLGDYIVAQQDTLAQLLIQQAEAEDRLRRELRLSRNGLW